MQFVNMFLDEIIAMTEWFSCRRCGKIIDEFMDDYEEPFILCHECKHRIFHAKTTSCKECPYRTYDNKLNRVVCAAIDKEITDVNADGFPLFCPLPESKRDV